MVGLWLPHRNTWGPELAGPGESGGREEPPTVCASSTAPTSRMTGRLGKDPEDVRVTADFPVQRQQVVAEVAPLRDIVRTLAQAAERDAQAVE